MGLKLIHDVTGNRSFAKLGHSFESSVGVDGHDSRNNGAVDSCVFKLIDENMSKPFLSSLSFGYTHIVVFIIIIIVIKSIPMARQSLMNCKKTSTS